MITGMAIAIGLFFILGPDNSPIASTLAMIVPFGVVPLVAVFILIERQVGEGFAAVGYVVPGRPGLRWNLINRENTTIFHGLDDIVCFADGRAQASYSEGAVIRSGYFNKVGDFIRDTK